MALSALDPKSFKITRDYLQDIAKILGKLQQVFLPAEVHDWQRGIEIQKTGLATQSFEMNGQPAQVFLHISEGNIEVGGQKWSLGAPAQEVFGQLDEWLQQQGAPKKIESPEFTTTQPQYDAEQAQQLTAAISWVTEQFTMFKQILSSDFSSPVLLFPHHFDVSYVWFADRAQAEKANDGPQVGMGFSTGDKTIQEPYFYITMYPANPKFTELDLDQPTYWQTQDFTGAVLKYNDLISLSNPEEFLREYFNAIQKHAAELLETS